MWCFWPCQGSDIIAGVRERKQGMTEEKTLTDEEDQALTEKAHQAVSSAIDKVLNPEVWGVEYYGDAPGGMGGGIPAFFWCDSREEMLDFVATHLTFVWAGPTSVDAGRVSRSAAAVVAKINDDSSSLSNGMLELNKVLKDFSQIRWWGQFQDLLTGDSAFEKKVRAWYREADVDDEGADSLPISADEIDQFIKALEEWGI
jgi:hypothetical protein